MMHVRKTNIKQDIRFVDSQTGVVAYSFATVNIDPKLYLTQKELKQRANTLAYA